MSIAIIVLHLQSSQSAKNTQMKAMILWWKNYVLENGLQSHFHHKTLHRRKKLHIFCHFIFHVFINQMLQEALALITRWNAAAYTIHYFFREQTGKLSPTFKHKGLIGSAKCFNNTTKT